MTVRQTPAHIALPPTRIFLDWDQPLLPQAAARLVERYRGDGVADLRGVTVVLPGGRARRRLVELLLEAADARGLTLIPPETVTVGRLADLLIEVPKPVADAAASRRAWSRALRATDADGLRGVFPRLPAEDDVPGWDALADLVAGLHDTVAGEGHRFADVARICGTGPGSGRESGGGSGRRRPDAEQPVLPGLEAAGTAEPLPGEAPPLEGLYDDAERWEVLAGVRNRYLAELERAGLLDGNELRLAALGRGVPRHRGDVWLISVVDLPGVTRRLLEASGAPVYAVVHAPEPGSPGAPPADPPPFDAWGVPVTEHWAEVDVPVTDAVLRVVDRPVDQADAVVEALEALGGRYAAEDVVLSVHPDTDVVPFLEQRLEARGVHPRYAAGSPLGHAAPVRLLQAVAAYLEDGAYEALAALLRHPDAGPLVEGRDGPTRLDAIEAADRFYVEHLPHRIGDTIPQAQGRAGRFAPVVYGLTSSGPLARLGGRRRMSRWMPDVMAILEVVYGARPIDRGRPSDRQLLDVLARLRSAAAALGALPEALDETCTAAAAIRALLVELRGEALPPEARRDALELLDWLEIPLDDAPVAVVTGFNEGYLPESMVGHPFLPDGLRSRLGLVDNRRRVARDAYRLTTVLRSREVVRLVAGRRSSTGDPLRPSRLMFRTSDDEVARRVLAFFKEPGDGPARPSLAALGLQPGAATRFRVPPEPELRLELAEPLRLRVTDFKALLADPYRFALERLLDLQGVDDDARELDALGFGSLAHDVLQGFGAAVLGGRVDLDVTDARAVRAFLFDFLEHLVGERFGDGALPAVALQAAQLRARLAAFAEAQATWAREGWRMAAVERQPAGDGVPFDVDGRPILLRGRIDRIDYHPETGRWAVLDYKTGNEVDEPDRAHRKGRGPGRRWIDLQLPLYRRLVAGVADENGDPLVDPAAAAEGRLVLGYVALPRDGAATAFMPAPWTDEELAEAEETARQAVRDLREGVFVFDPTVTRPSRYGNDALEPLLTRGWQATGDGANGAGSDGDAGAWP